jgi:hypothetical protein
MKEHTVRNVGQLTSLFRISCHMSLTSTSINKVDSAVTNKTIPGILA